MVEASVDEDTDIKNISIVILDDIATKNKTDNSIASNSTSKTAKYTQEQAFTPDFKYNKLKELQWSPE